MGALILEFCLDARVVTSIATACIYSRDSIGTGVELHQPRQWADLYERDFTVAFGHMELDDGREHRDDRRAATRLPPYASPHGYSSG